MIGVIGMIEVIRVFGVIGMIEVIRVFGVIGVFGDVRFLPRHPGGPVSLILRC